MPWRESSVVEQRLAFVIRATSPGAHKAALCREFGISRPTGDKWVRRFAADGLAGLWDQSRRPHHSPRQVSAAVEAAILRVRDRYGWNGRTLQPLVAAEEGVTVSHATIARVLKRRGRIDPTAVHRPAPQRFERPTPNALWQMDFKGQYPVREGWCFPLSVLDDHSRFLVALAACSNQQTAGVAAVLRTAFRRYGVPDAILTDHGVPWHAPANEWGLTRLAVQLIRQGITLVHGRPYHPQTQGKVERFHRTLGAWLRFHGVPQDLGGFAAELPRFQAIYNERKPHRALAGAPPARRYRSSGRAYQPDPPPWVYPAGAALCRVNRNGAVTVERHRFFVSRALSGEQVWCQAVGSRVLVIYRHMHVRELDLTTGRSVPVLRRQPVGPPLV